MIRFGVGSLPGSGRVNLGRGAPATKVISFHKDFVNKMNLIWEGSLPRSGKGNSEERSPGNKREQFPSEIVNKINIFWEGGLLVLERVNLRRGSQATKVISFLEKL